MKKKFNLEKAYHLFLLIRKTEEKIIDLYSSDKIKSPVHLSIGQEAIAVGVSMALSDEDIIFSNYRGHAHFIAREANYEKMYKELDKLPIFSNSEYVIIENQPVLKNPTMKSIQMMLYSYFLKKYITDIEPEKRILKDIVLMSAKNKLKIYDGPALTHINKIKSQYSRNKKLAIEHCKYIIEQDCVDEQWIELFKNSSKKDDLSDAHLMTKYFIMKKFKII